MDAANTNPSNSERKFLSNFHHSITGDASKPKLVFLHGVMGFALNWRRIAKAFEADYQVLAYDQRGHGRSFHPASGYSPEDYANDLEKILDELGWREITLVGHSMGGRASYSFAARHPERVTRLVIEDIGPKTYDTGTGVTLVEQMLDVVPVPFESKKAAREWFSTEFPRLFSAQKKKLQLAEYLYANIMETTPKGPATWRFSEAGVRESVAQGRAAERWDDISALKMPTLVMRGEFSGDLPREVFEKMLSLNPNIQGIEIAGSGHWIHSDKPEIFIETLETFFRGDAVPAESKGL